MRILHVIPDDKFWTTIKAMFDLVDVQNEYYCIVDNCLSKTRFVDSTIMSTIPRESSFSLWNREDIDVYIFHSIPFEYYDHILCINGNKPIIVVSWGFDIYSPQKGCPPLLPLPLYKPKTASLLKTNGERRILSSRAKRVFKFLLKKDYRIQRLGERQLAHERVIKQRQVLNRVDYWATVLPNEFELLRTHSRIKALPFPLHYTYRHLSDEIPTIDSRNAELLLIGNSADPSNNHIDILDLLERRNIRRGLFIPMAYGDDKFRDVVVGYVKSHSLTCDIQTELVPREEYKKKLMHCRAAVFGHIRQQAVGNINICMLQGIKVFLYKDSVAYKYFKSIGSFVFSIEDDLFPEEILKPLTKEQNELNRKNLDWLSLDYVVPEVEKALEKIESEFMQAYS